MDRYELIYFCYKGRFYLVTSIVQEVAFIDKASC